MGSLTGACRRGKCSSPSISPIAEHAMPASRSPAHPVCFKVLRMLLPTISSVPMGIGENRMRLGVRSIDWARMEASRMVRGRRCRFMNRARPDGRSPSFSLVATTSASAMPVSAEKARSVEP